MLRAVGTKLYDGDKAVRLTGVNDTTVLAFQSGQMLGTYSAYKYSNHNLPQYPVPGSGDSDRDCKIPSESYKEFWYKYFWMLKNKLGGAINCAPPYGLHAEMSGTTSLNHIRIGGHDSWGRSMQYRAFKNARATFDEAMKDILDMAQANGIYVNITMGGNPCDDDYTHTDFGAGAIFNPGDTAYLNFVQWCAQFINAYGNHPAIACFNLFNEPTYTWFKNKYGEAIGTDGYPAWKSKMMAWKIALIGDVKAKVTLNPMPLMAIAGGEATIWWGIWDGHSQADIDKEKKETQDWWVADDIIIGHPYWGAEDDYLINWKKQTENFMNKPMYIEEWGYNQTTTGEPWIAYWPWGDLKFQQYDIDECKMQLNAMPNPTGTYAVPKLPYPGYPIPASVLDEAKLAWIEFNVPIPPELTAIIDATPKEGYSPVEVKFSSVVNGGYSPYSYLWDFGDGQSSTETSPTVTFDTVGTFIAVLQVTDSKGTKVLSNEISIKSLKPLPVPIGFVPGYDFIIPADQIQQGKVTVKLPDVTTPLPNGSTTAMVAAGKTEKIFGKQYACSVNIPAMTVKNPSVTILMPTIQFDLPPVNIMSKTIHIGTMAVYSENQ
jgi:PKD repeat protein